MKVRIYYEDTDCGKVVYYANYLKYMERSRTEFLRERGLNLSLLHEQGGMLVVVEVHVRYKAPARYDDLLEVTSNIKEFTPVSILFLTTMKNEEGKLLVTGEAKLVYLDAQGKISHIPQTILTALDLEP